MRAKKRSTAKKPARAKKAARRGSTFSPKVITVAVICVMAGGIAIAARQQQGARAKDEAAALTADMPASYAALARTADTSRRTTAVAAPAAVSVAAVSTPAPMRDTAEPSSVSTTPVTITGCLERDGDGFRLKDTAGANVPKARSWKSGFMRKGSATVDIVDPSHALGLAGQVGRRVSVTGTLADRELRADAMHRVAASCKAD